MGANLVPDVRNFFITHETFGVNSGDVKDGCVQPNLLYKLLRFDFLSKNIGDQEFNVGSPVTRPDLFVYSQAHQHYHMKEFNKYTLINASGTVVVPSKKPGFCLADVEPIRPNPAPQKFSLLCEETAEMGVSAGWADVYIATLGCQFLIIDGVPDGLYTLVCTTNSAHAVDKNGVPEDKYSDNTISVMLDIAGDTIQVVPWRSRIRLIHLAHELDPHWLLDLWLAIHGGDPAPEQRRQLEEVEEHLARAVAIIHEIEVGQRAAASVGR
jgi:hypothetical protein